MLSSLSDKNIVAVSTLSSTLELNTPSMLFSNSELFARMASSTSTDSSFPIAVLTPSITALMFSPIIMELSLVLSDPPV